MNDDRESPWSEVQLDQRQWANMPESAGLWAGVSPDDTAEARLRVNEEMGLILHVMVLEAALTKIQRQVLELYYFEGRKQVEIAMALGISQPTVSQHLRGKKRGGRHVGGALINSVKPSTRLPCVFEQWRHVRRRSSVSWMSAKTGRSRGNASKGLWMSWNASTTPQLLTKNIK